MECHERLTGSPAKITRCLHTFLPSHLAITFPIALLLSCPPVQTSSRHSMTLTLLLSLTELSSQPPTFQLSVLTRPVPAFFALSSSSGLLAFVSFLYQPSELSSLVLFLPKITSLAEVCSCCGLMMLIIFG